MSADRDRILEQALKHELRAAGTPPAGGCLDAETLGAWADGGLDAAGIAAAEAHVSNCARCQALVGAFSRSNIAPETKLATPGLAWWKWGLAPIAAAVAASTLWMVIPEQQQIAVAPPQAKESAAAQAIPEVAMPTPVAPAASPARADDQFAARDTTAPLARENRTQPPVIAEQKQEAPAKIQERVALADSAGTAASAAARAEAPAGAPAAPPTPAIAALEASPSAQIGGLQKRQATSVAPRFEVPTLRPSIRWRVIGDFFVELTLDSGATWIRKHQLPGITAGSAPSALVCWFVGGNGSVWLTTDGAETFRNVGLAEPLDIASIAATSATTAQVFTVSGRRFQTADAGRTWQPF